MFKLYQGERWINFFIAPISTAVGTWLNEWQQIFSISL
jgi:hypothetical protein